VTIAIATAGEDVPLLEGIRTTRAIRRLRPAPVSTNRMRSGRALPPPIG
jgi:hypothetical protein